jgi:hypothetical protein
VRLVGSQGGVCGVKAIPLVNSTSACLTAFTTVASQPLLSASYGTFLAAYPATENCWTPSGTATPCVAAALAGTTLSNYVKEAYLRVNADKNALEIGYVLDSTTFATAAGVKTVQQRFEVSFGSNAVGVVRGYLKGDPLLVIDGTNVQRGRVRIPFNPGVCTANRFTNLKLQFLQNVAIFCWGSAAVDFTAIANTLKSISRYGPQSPLHSNDLIKVTVEDGAASWSSMNIQVFYSRVGPVSFQSYEIARVTVGPGSQSKLAPDKAVYLSFMELENAPKFFKADPPTVTVYLPDDVLYPF